MMFRTLSTSKFVFSSIRSNLYTKGLVERVSCNPARVGHIKALSSGPNEGGKPPPQEKNDTKYFIRFKDQESIKTKFKKFYSLYGPLFVVCHIGVGLTSLGFFSAIVWLVVDPIEYIPSPLFGLMTEVTRNVASGGSKFAIAYALHKLSLPFRLVIAVRLTQALAPRIKWKFKPFGRKT